MNAIDVPGAAAVEAETPPAVEDPALLAYVEEVGRYFESLGWPRMAGRMFGALLVADEREQSAADLAELLHASRGSISTTSRLLRGVGMIERHTRRGDRRDFYRLTNDGWIANFQAKMLLLSDLRRLGERGLAATPPSAVGRRALEDLIDLCAFYERELPDLNERWRQERAAREGTTA